MAPSDLSGTSYFITQMQLFETLGRPRLAPGEVTTVHAQVLMPGHVQTPFDRSCLPHNPT